MVRKCRFLYTVSECTVSSVIYLNLDRWRSSTSVLIEHLFGGSVWGGNGERGNSFHCAAFIILCGSIRLQCFFTFWYYALINVFFKENVNYISEHNNLYQWGPSDNKLHQYFQFDIIFIGNIKHPIQWFLLLLVVLVKNVMENYPCLSSRDSEVNTLLQKNQLLVQIFS